MAFNKHQISRMNLDPRIFSVDEDEEENSEEESQENQVDSGEEFEPVDDDEDLFGSLREDDPFPESPDPENRWENTWVNRNNAWTINNNEWNSNSEWEPRSNLNSELWNFISDENGSTDDQESVEDFKRCKEMFKIFVNEFGFELLKYLTLSSDHKSFIRQLSVMITHDRLESDLDKILNDLSQLYKTLLVEFMHELERKNGINPEDRLNPYYVDFSRLALLLREQQLLGE